MNSHEMVNTAIEQVTIPQIEHPVVLGASAAVTAALLWHSNRKYGQTEEVAAMDFANPALAEAAISQVREENGTTGADVRKRRLRPVRLGAWAVGLTLAGAAGGLHYEDDTPIDGAQVAVVVDSS